MSDPHIPARLLLLLAESDHDLRTYLAVNLRADGFDVTQAATAEHLRAKLTTERPALLVLGELDGQPVVATLSAVREAAPDQPVDPDLPVLCLGRKGDELAELRTLRAGADDHVRKPVHYALLLARIVALLRRCNAATRRGRIRIGALHLDAAARTARVGPVPVELSRIEFQLLVRLASEPTRVFSKAELLRDVWGYHRESRTRTLDSHACRLRNKLAQAGASRHVVNVWGVGYRLLDPVTAPERNGAA
jgi:DNA-binding response OmpR family regulator